MSGGAIALSDRAGGLTRGEGGVATPVSYTTNTMGTGTVIVIRDVKEARSDHLADIRRR